MKKDFYRCQPFPSKGADLSEAERWEKIAKVLQHGVERARKVYLARLKAQATKF